MYSSTLEPQHLFSMICTCSCTKNMSINILLIAIKAKSDGIKFFSTDFLPTVFLLPIDKSARALMTFPRVLSD